MPRLVFVPPIPLSAFPFEVFEAYVMRITPDTLREIVQRNKEYTIECYIRHESTVRVLSNYLGIELRPSSALYQYQPGDVIIIVGLRNPVRGKEVQVTSIEDLDIALVRIKPR